MISFLRNVQILARWSLVVMAMLLLAAGFPSRAEVIDRIVAVVNQQVITLGDLEEEKKFQDLGLATNAILADKSDLEKQMQSDIIHRLIQQRLIREQVISFPGSEATPGEIQSQMELLRQKWGGEERFQQTLAADHITLQELQQRIAWQIQVMKFVDSRFRQFVMVQPKEVEDYYENTFLPELAKRQESPSPPLQEVEERIRQILTEEKINSEVESWLNALTQSATIANFN